MNGSNSIMKKVCIGLGAVVVVLLLAIAFLLGKQSAAKKSDGAGRNTADVVVTSEPAAQAYTEADSAPENTVPTEAATEKPSRAQETAEPITPAPPVTQPAVPSSSEGPRTLEIEMSNGSLTFETGTIFDVKYDSSVIQAENAGGVLSIRNAKSKPSASERKRMDVTVVVPEGYYFDDVDVEFGAGKLITKTLRTRDLEMEMGAGSATLEGLTVTGSADIKNGAGAFAIKSGSINDLTLQCGAGATQVKAALTGSSRIVAAVGAVDLEFDGEESDYTVTFNMSLGACYYNDTKISRSGTFGSGPNRVDITGGLGVMRVNVG